jgi:choline dehydrogenase-like flavoprotein
MNSMSAANHYDVIIIGSGAGGGTLAFHLAPSGKRILILERGEYLKRERDNWSSRAAVRDEKYHAPEKWLDSNGREFQPGTHYNVGGNTKFYGAALFRMREEDFGEIQHAGGVSPAWPISYSDLEPYYAQAEHLYEVRGERGIDPTEPWSSTPYPFPAVSHEPRIQELNDHFARMGLAPFKVPLGVRMDELRPESSLCIRCSTCDGFPCMVNAKADAHTMCVQPATRHDNVTLLTNATAVRITTTSSGNAARGVVVERDGMREEFTADYIVSSCGAINSAALLLRSSSDAHPRGLANSSDLVGRNYMSHNNSVLFLFCLKSNPTQFQKTVAVNDFYRASREWAYPMGHISMVGKFDGHMFKAGAPAFTPWRLLEAMGKRSLDFWLTSEDLPDSNNRVTLNNDNRVQLNYTENNLEAHNRLIATLKHVMRDFDGGRWMSKGGKVPLGGVGHQCGTLRFGTDARTSVLDINCRAHDVDNLYAVDGSFFCSSSAVNPAITIMANALRVGDHLLERMGVSSELRNEYAPVNGRRLCVVA